MNAASCLVMACFWIVWHRKHVEGRQSDCKSKGAGLACHGQIMSIRKLAEPLKLHAFPELQTCTKRHVEATTVALLTLSPVPNTDPVPSTDHNRFVYLSRPCVDGEHVLIFGHTNAPKAQ